MQAARPGRGAARGRGRAPRLADVPFGLGDRGVGYFLAGFGGHGECESRPRVAVPGRPSPSLACQITMPAASMRKLVGAI